MAGTDERADGPDTPAPLAQEPDDVDTPMFRVVALGDQGSGKTNFITMLYKQLSHDGDFERGYYLSTRLDQGIVLNREAAKTASAGRVWAAKTTWVDSRIDLDFQVPLAGAPAGVLRIRLIDYPGEYLRDATAGSQDQRDALGRAIAEADALLLLVDGHRLLRALKGGPADKDEFAESMAAAIRVVQDAPMVNTGRAAPPIQVLVTKWDMLAPMYPLARVRELLMQDGNFRTMVSVRRAGPGAARVRIIPVSVVGYDAIDVEVQEQNGIRVEIPVKRAGDRSPVNLDVPICAVLPDRLDQILAGLSPRMRKRAQRRERLATLRAQGGKVRRLARLSDSTQETVSTVVGWIVHGPSKQMSKSILAMAAQWAEQKAAPARPGPPAPSAEALRRVDQSSVLARSALLLLFAERLKRFERDYPGWDADEGLQNWLQRRAGNGA